MSVGKPTGSIIFSTPREKGCPAKSSHQVVIDALDGRLSKGKKKALHTEDAIVKHGTARGSSGPLPTPWRNIRQTSSHPRGVSILGS